MLPVPPPAFASRCRRCALLAALLLAACPAGPADDDDSGDDDDSALDDDDDSGDDDDSALDDDDSASGDCVEDAWEDNDDLAGAVAAPPSRTRVRHLRVCDPGDEDWYRFDLIADDVLTVELFFEQDDGDLELQLLDADGTPLAESRSDSDDELAWHRAAVDGPHYARVWLADDAGAPGVAYDLSNSVCFDDEWEDNDDLTTAAPVDLPNSLLDMNTCAVGEEDWFVLQGVQAGELLDIRFVYFGAHGNLDASLFGPDGDELARGANAAHVETILHFATEPGDYVLRVWLVEDLAGPGLFYDVDLNVGVPPGDCDDRFEPDNTSADATAITATLYEDFAVCLGDPDHFSFDARAGDEVTVWIDFPHAEGDVDLHLFDADGVELAAATSADDDELLVATIPADGAYVARVSQVDDDGGLTGNVYNLSLDGLSQLGCVPDGWEPNDTPEAANPIPNGDWLDQTICPGEDDWYQLQLSALQLLEVNLGSWHYFEGNADVFLLDADLTVVASSEATFGNERFLHTVAASGTYYLRVTLTEDEGVIAGQIYDFGVLSLHTSACPADVWEPNDSVAQAAVVFPGPLPGANVCLGEPDYFAFDVPAGSQATVAVVLDPGEGELALTLLDADGDLVGSATTAGGEATVQATAGAGGIWTVGMELVTDPGEAGAVYDADVLVVGP